MPGISLDVRHMLGDPRGEFPTPVVHEARYEILAALEVPVEAPCRDSETPDKIADTELCSALSRDDFQGRREPLLSGESFSPHRFSIDTFASSRDNNICSRARRILWMKRLELTPRPCKRPALGESPSR